jgi:hypothetical protein
MMQQISAQTHSHSTLLKTHNFGALHKMTWEFWNKTGAFKLHKI